MPDEMNAPRRRRVRQVMPEQMAEPAPAGQEAPARTYTPPKVVKEIPEGESAALGVPSMLQKKTHTAAAKPQHAQAEPDQTHRIIIDDDDAPDWMVSAGRVSGAAQRRVAQAAPKAQEAAPEQAAKPRTARPAAKKAATLRGMKLPGARTGGQAKPKASAPRAEAARAEKKPAPRRKMTKKERMRRARSIRTGVISVLALAVVVTLIVVGVTGMNRLMDIKKTLDRGDGVFYPNIFVNNIPLEGRTLDEAAAIVTQQVSSLISSWRITLRTQDGRSWDITGEDLKMSYDVADQLDQLWAIGHTGSSAQRYEQVKALEDEAIMRYTTLSYDMSAVNQILTQIKAEVDREPVSATKVYDDSKWPPYSYTDDVPGQELDITGMNEHIMGMVDTLQSGVVDLSPTPVQAPVTRKYLESQIVKLASYETSIAKAGQYAEARHENIRIGTEKFNKLTIKSGEQVSFNKVTGLRTVKNGFVVALELAYGEYVEGVGGGICQVSSTLYNAVVNAGLEIKTRTQHSLPSSYVEKGLDATVQDNRLDFVFKNSTSSDIFIDTEFYKGKNGYYRCKFNIWGRPDPNGYTYKLVSEVKETIPIPEMVYRKDKDMKYVIYDDEEYLASEGQEGYIVDVYRVTMDASGLEVNREKMYTDTYKAVAPVTYVGVTPRPTPEPEITPYAID